VLTVGFVLLFTSEVGVGFYRTDTDLYDLAEKLLMFWCNRVSSDISANSAAFSLLCEFLSRLQPLQGNLHSLAQ